MKFLGNKRGASTADYLLITAVIAGISFPIVKKFIGDETLGAIRQSRGQLVSFIAQDRKQSVPNEWFNKDPYPPFDDPNPDGGPPNGKPPGGGPPIGDEGGGGPPGPDGNPPPGLGGNPLDGIPRYGENDPRNRDKGNPNSPSSPNYRKTTPPDTKSVWNDFIPNKKPGTPDTQSPPERMGRKGWIKTGSLNEDQLELYAQVVDQEDEAHQDPSGKVKRHKNRDEGAQKKKGENQHIENDDPESSGSGSIDWWWLIKILIILLIIFLIILILLGNLRRR